MMSALQYVVYELIEKYDTFVFEKSVPFHTFADKKRSFFSVKPIISREMKSFFRFAGVCCAMVAAFAGCSKNDGFKYGEISVSPSAVSGMYSADHNVMIHTDASGNVTDEHQYEDNPGWMGSVTAFYEFAGDGKIVGYTRYRFTGDSEEQCWYLKQTDEQISKNVLKADVGKRIAETNLWNQTLLKMTIYSSDENEIVLWLENKEAGERWYDAYTLTKVTDAAAIASLKENPKADTEENRSAVLSEIKNLLGRD